MQVGQLILWFEQGAEESELVVVHVFNNGRSAVLAYDGAENADPGEMRVAEACPEESGAWWLHGIVYRTGVHIRNDRSVLSETGI